MLSSAQKGSVQDYRKDSYKAIAEKSKQAREEAAKKKSEEQKSTSVSIKPEFVVSGGGQKAIRGKISENVQYSSNAQPQEQQQPIQTTSSVSTNNPFLAQNTAGTKIPLSPGVVGVLRQQSVRADVPYYAVVQQNTRNMSIDRTPPTITDERSTLQRVYEVSPFYTIFEGTKNLFKKQGETTFSDVRGRYEQNNEPLIRANVFGLKTPIITTPKGQASYDVAILAGVFATGKTLSPLSNKQVSVFSNAKVLQVAEEKGFTNVIKFEPGETVGVLKSGGVLPRFNFKYGFYNEEPFSISGVVIEKASATGRVGELSKETIFSTRQTGALYVKSLVTGKANIVRVSSLGGEVGGFGNKIVTIESGRTSLRTENFGSFVERYRGKNVGEADIVGIVSKRGQSFGILKPSITTERFSIFDIKSVGESEIGYQARSLSGNVLDRLLKEQPVPNLPRLEGFGGSSNLLTQTSGRSVLSILPENLVKQTLQASSSRTSLVSRVSPASSSLILSRNQSAVSVLSSQSRSSSFNMRSFSLTSQSVAQVSSSAFRVSSRDVLGYKFSLSSGSVVAQKSLLSQSSLLSQKQNLRSEQALSLRSSLLFRPLAISSFAGLYAPPSGGFFGGLLPSFKGFSSIGRKSKRRGARYRSSFRKSDLLALPDLFSVNITEARTGREAIAPLLTPSVARASYKAFYGFGGGRVPTYQMQRGLRV